MAKITIKNNEEVTGEISIISNSNLVQNRASDNISI